MGGAQWVEGLLGMWEAPFLEVKKPGHTCLLSQNVGRRQEDQEFKVSLGHVVSSRPA